MDRRKGKVSRAATLAAFFCFGALCGSAAALAQDLDPASPYDILELLPTRSLTLADLEVTLGATVPDTGLSDADYDAWIRQSAGVVSAYLGRFPVPRLKLLLLGTNGKGVRFGSAFGNHGTALRIYIGERTNRRDLLVEDWILVHEMVHTVMPKLNRRHHWLEEGVATYVESVARLQADYLPAEQVWGGFVRGMPNGLPRRGEQGLDSSSRWGSVYWGGALFCLLADYRIRLQTGNRKSLADALRGLGQAGGTIEQSWPVAQVIAAADEATGTPVFAELYETMGRRAGKIDLEKLWRELGVVPGSGGIGFDDSAPAAHIRRAIGEP